eukprot:TRINITY_DN12909_c0_g3_i3.p1 TRINITY_DN12909_c0_g3~~TRINITY_DN12909_c0_g3_i3.p1  ORF type:complete len:146 (+),score=33.62 TRINITY_DN12909_c0_g3_i3:245-682(+)
MRVDDKMVKLQIWDTAGQERYRSLITNYLRDAPSAILVYDITSTSSQPLDRTSFESVRQWVKDVRNLRGDEVKIMLVGNKTDLEDRRAVGMGEGKSLANELGLGFIETSSKTGSNVYELFKSVASSLPGLEDVEIVDEQESTTKD